MDLASTRRIHVVGVGGAGMSAIATVLSAMGHQVSGSDLRPSARLDRLADAGVAVHVGHDAANGSEADLVAVSTVIGSENPEVVAARHAGVEVVSRARILASICATRRVLAVAGTHGKTTTAAMLARILLEAGWAPSWIVGGDIVGADGGHWDPAGKWLVVEADESDGTFLVLPRLGGIVTSVEADHLDFYGDEATMVGAYERFLTGCPGPRVVCSDDEGAAALQRPCALSGLDSVSYGVSSGSTFTITSLIERRSGIGFDVEGPSGGSGRVELAVPGIYNARNATAAVAMAVTVGVPLDVATAGVERFAGVARRVERRGERDGVTYVDDYAHLPGEVATVIATMARAGWARVVAVFQPHRYSRTAAHHEAFAQAFDGADVVVVTGIYPCDEAPLPGVSGRLVADAISGARPELALFYCEDLTDLPAVMAKVLRPGDLCLTLGAGDLTDVVAHLVSGR